MQTSHVVLQEKSDAECAVASYGTHEGRVAAATTLPGTSLARPALAVVGGQQFLAWVNASWRKRDAQLSLMTVSTANGGAPMSLGWPTDRAPAVCGFGDRLTVAWRDHDRHLKVRAAGGEGWGPPVALPAKCILGPAMCEHRGNLALAWIGSGRRINVAMLRPS